MMKKLSLTWGILFLGIFTEINSAQKHFKSLLNTIDCLLHRIMTRNLMDSKQYWMKKSLNNVHSCRVLFTTWITHMLIEICTENIIECIWKKWKEWKGIKTLLTKMTFSTTFTFYSKVILFQCTEVLQTDPDVNNIIGGPGISI